MFWIQVVVVVVVVIVVVFKNNVRPRKRYVLLSTIHVAVYS